MTSAFRLTTGLLAGVLLTGLLPASETATAQTQPGAKAPCAIDANRLWCDTSLSPGRRADLVLDAMTRDEKLDFLAGDTRDGHAGGNDGVPRLGVPGMDHTDGAAGVRQDASTALPAPISLAATWDPRSARRYAALIGAESRNKGNDVAYGPNVNIARVPENGRSFEAFGEDPELTSRIAVAWVRGLQRTGVIGSVKHYVANNQETQRYTTNAVIGERALHEIYLPAFEATVKKADVGTVMLGYHSVNGEFMTENCHLVNGVLKRDWGFRGPALSDYVLAMKSTVDATNCGTDLELPSPVFFSKLSMRIALAAGRTTWAAVDEHVHRQLRTMFAFGVFDRPPFPEAGSIDYRAHARRARKLAEQGTVLLRNRRRTLPLDSHRLRTIAVIGVPADHYVGGAGSSQVDAVQPPVTVLEGIRDRVGRRTEVVYESGRNVARAAQAAADADVAVVVAADREGEDRDRRCLSLRSWCMPPSLLDADGPGPDYGNQDALIRKVAAAQPNTVVVLETGGPVLMPWADRVPAIVEGWYPGQEGGTAIARVLFGDVNPSGHLPITFPAHERDPATDRASHRERYPGILGTARYSEGVLVGYRHYDSHGIKPTFPFGHGLSYTRFAYDRLRVTRRPRSHGLTIRVDVTNTGRRRGAEVVQTYLGMPDASARVTQPPKWLRAFDKVHLRPGQTKRVTMRLNRRDLAYWNAGQNSWAVADGTYQVMVGRSSRDIRLRTRTRVD